MQDCEEREQYQIELEIMYQPLWRLVWIQVVD